MTVARQPGSVRVVTFLKASTMGLLNTRLDRTVNMHDSPYCHHFEAAVQSCFESVLLIILFKCVLPDNSVIDCLKYLVPYSKCTPFSCLFHVHYCDSTVLSHCVPQDALTALMYASGQGHTDVVQLFLSAGAQVDLQSKVRHNINLRAMSLCIADATF